jgi:DNA-binding Lrp family transcriptional regulator
LSKARKSPEQPKLRNIDIAILEGLALYGVRNMTKLSAKLNISPGILRRRIKYLRSHFSLYLLGNPYHTNIGLRKVFVFAESKPGYENLLYECLKSNDYWLWVEQCIGIPKCLAIYGIPAGKEPEFEEFVRKLREIEQVRNLNFVWSTCIQSVNATSTWFDKSSEEWIFPWDSWLKEVQSNHEELPNTLREPDGYVQKADWIDIMILKELEKNSAIKLKEIAKKLNLSLQALKYHFENHVIREQMFEGPQIIANHYKELSPDMYYFRFVFQNYENLSKFANSLMNKPFVRAIGKTYRENQLLVQIYLPRQQLRNFIEALSKLIKTMFLNTYEYMIMDPTKKERQTISYEYFKDNNWEYDHKKYLENMQATLKKCAASI